ncbi:hypothetical protein B0H19DRAFT_1267744 [Mycena capillaripes]|nr:hypothetical protein B0H19DRAFT_1267744 [Mycena capillaripes]
MLSIVPIRILTLGAEKFTTWSGSPHHCVSTIYSEKSTYTIRISSSSITVPCAPLHLWLNSRIGWLPWGDAGGNGELGAVATTGIAGVRHGVYAHTGMFKALYFLTPRFGTRDENPEMETTAGVHGQHGRSGCARRTPSEATTRLTAPRFHFTFPSRTSLHPFADSHPVLHTLEMAWMDASAYGSPRRLVGTLVLTQGSSAPSLAPDGDA